MTELSAPAAPMLRITTGITALKLTNNLGVNNIIETKSWIKAG